MIELEDTVDLMLSDNFSKRLVAEYAQAVLRHEKMIDHLLNGLISMDSDYMRLSRDNNLHAAQCWALICRECSLSAQENINAWLFYNSPLDMTIFEDDCEDKEQ